MSSKADRRRILRINLDAPIQAKLSSAPVTLRDISATGARVEHPFPLTLGKDVVLDVIVGEEQVTITCQVIRCKLEQVEGHTSYCTGLRFQDSDKQATLSLKRIIGDAVSRDFEARKQHMLKIKK